MSVKRLGWVWSWALVAGLCGCSEFEGAADGAAGGPAGLDGDSLLAEPDAVDSGGGGQDAGLGGEGAELDAIPPPSDAPGADASGAMAVVSVEPLAVSFRSTALLRLTGEHLSAATSVLVGGRQATIVGQTNDTIDVSVPPPPHGGPALVEVLSDLEAAVFQGFRYLGIPPPLLRWVELPGSSPPLDGTKLVPLRGGQTMRVVVVSESGIALMEVDAAGNWKEIWDETIPGAGLGAACAADFDGDEVDDLFLATDGPGSGVWLHVANGLAVPAQVEHGLVAHLASCADLDGDGAIDVLLAGVNGVGSPSLRLLRGDSRGSLAAGVEWAVGGAARSLAVGDVDADGRADVLVGRKGMPPRLWTGDGRGVFSDAPAGSLPPGGTDALVALGDMNGDGLPDAVLLTSSGAAIWVNQEGALVDIWSVAPSIEGGAAERVELVDLDADGSLDVFIEGESGARLLRNDGSGGLFDYTHAMLARAGEAPLMAYAMLDADADRDPDFVALRPAGGAVLLRSWDPLPFSDPDGDGIPTELDGCPAAYDPAQSNRDSWHFSCDGAEACLADTGCGLHVATAHAAYLVCSSMTVSAPQARAFCEGRGASLLSLADAEEMALVAGFGPGRFWLDLGDSAQEGQFVTAVGEVAPFLSWGQGQPDNAGGAEHCVELLASDPSQPYFNDLPCDYGGIAVVCEDVVKRAVADPPDACDVCPKVVDVEQVDTDGDGVGDACEEAEP